MNGFVRFVGDVCLMFYGLLLCCVLLRLSMCFLGGYLFVCFVSVLLRDVVCLFRVCVLCLWFVSCVCVLYE